MFAAGCVCVEWRSAEPTEACLKYAGNCVYSFCSGMAQFPFCSAVCIARILFRCIPRMPLCLSIVAG